MSIQNESTASLQNATVATETKPSNPLPTGKPVDKDFDFGPVNSLATISDVPLVHETLSCFAAIERGEMNCLQHRVQAAFNLHQLREAWSTPGKVGGWLEKAHNLFKRSPQTLTDYANVGKFLTSKGITWDTLKVKIEGNKEMAYKAWGELCAESACFIASEADKREKRGGPKRKGRKKGKKSPPVKVEDKTPVPAQAPALSPAEEPVPDATPADDVTLTFGDLWTLTVVPEALTPSNRAEVGSVLQDAAKKIGELIANQKK